MVEAIFFDLYETLITEWQNNQRKATYSSAELGIDAKIFKKAWSARREKRMDGTFLDHQSCLKDILQSLDKPINENVIEEIHQRRLEAKLVPFKEIDTEILQVLQILKDKDIKVGLISNCTAEEVVGWEDSPLANFFDEVVFSYKVKQAKPNAKIYLMACQCLEVSPERSLFIGDGGSNELYGASKVGLKAYQATWFQPDFISEKITGFPKLDNPMQITELIER
ncbi:haloacid dehalogenase [Bacillus sp. J14TS2]|uniref:HAD family hydrolase n=1 Tax=Bacillus sp. J14TS2 TaxID=2807188 RepID=UPI001B069C5E|nr:HAD family hydrolase [Bacillus sp. J14TS2]GIN74131.1 haloacid dehalogenase [Bacillus sp. J14TS2]